jgi:hypothetical protein
MIKTLQNGKYCRALISYKQQRKIVTKRAKTKCGQLRTTFFDSVLQNEHLLKKMLKNDSLRLANFFGEKNYFLGILRFEPNVSIRETF